MMILSRAVVSMGGSQNRLAGRVWRQTEPQMLRELLREWPFFYPSDTGAWEEKPRPNPPYTPYQSIPLSLKSLHAIRTLQTIYLSSVAQCLTQQKLFQINFACNGSETHLVPVAVRLAISLQKFPGTNIKSCNAMGYMMKLFKTVRQQIPNQWYTLFQEHESQRKRFSAGIGM